MLTVCKVYLLERQSASLSHTHTHAYTHACTHRENFLLQFSFPNEAGPSSRSQALHQGLSHGWQESGIWTTSCCLPAALGSRLGCTWPSTLAGQAPASLASSNAHPPIGFLKCNCVWVFLSDFLNSDNITRWFKNNRGRHLGPNQNAWIWYLIVTLNSRLVGAHPGRQRWWLQ